MTEKNINSKEDKDRALHDGIVSVPQGLVMNAHIGAEAYETMYQLSISDTDNFWAARAEEFLAWSKPWEEVNGSALVAERLNGLEVES